MRWITLENRAGETIQAGPRRMTPLSSLVRVQIPGWKGGLVWNRPSGVVVTEPDGEEKLLPVRDVTRLTQFLILGAGLLGGWLIWLAFRPGKTK